MNKGKGEEKKRRLDGFTKGVGIYTIFAIVVYIIIERLKRNGYMFIETAIEYWMCFAMLVGVFVLIARFLMNLPRTNTYKRVVRISAIALCVSMIFLAFIYTRSSLDDALRPVATLKSPDEQHTIFLMRSDSKFYDEDTKEETVLTLYRAMPKRNALFCNSNASDDIIVLRDDVDADINMQWTETGLILTTDGTVWNGLSTIKLDLK